MSDERNDSNDQASDWNSELDIPVTALKQKYEFLEEIGSGGAGVVYKALQLPIKRPVAVKMIHSHLVTPLAVKRFLKEAKTISRLSHPNIISIFDFGMSEEHQPFMVVDFVKGTPLSDLIDEMGRLPLDLTETIALQICDGLTHAHSRGILHRDLKPSNVMIVETESGETLVKILDFGLAKIVSGENENEDLTKSGETVGTPAFMSPEQVMGKELDQRSDLYSLGCVLYHCLAGVPPFIVGTKMEIMLMHLNDKPVPLNVREEQPLVPPEVESIISNLLAKKPDDRFQSMDALKNAIIARNQRITVAGAAEPPKVSATKQLDELEQKAIQKVPTKNLVPLVTVAFLLITGVVYLFVNLLMRDPEPAPTTTPNIESALPDSEPLTETDTTNGASLKSKKEEKPRAPRITDPEIANEKFLARMEDNPNSSSISSDGNSVTDAVLSKVASMPNLEKLNLEDSLVTDAGLKNLEGKNISVLNLKNTKITSAGVNSIARMPMLRDLDLSDTALDDSVVDSLCKLQGLSRLALMNCKISRSQMFKFQRKCPSCLLEMGADWRILGTK